MNNFAPTLVSGASVEILCDCNRNKTQAASRIDVFPSPFAPMKKLNPGDNSSASESKQRKFLSCKSANIGGRNKQSRGVAGNTLEGRRLGRQCRCEVAPQLFSIMLRARRAP